MNRSDGKDAKSMKEMSKLVRRNDAAPSSIVQHQEDGHYIFAVNEQLEAMTTAWLTVYNQHVGKECTWSNFLEHYGRYEPGAPGANSECPGPELLHQRASRAKDESSAGSDG